ncbi:hypothetical protein BDV93DRAFT_528696 [Ceratobasidium sp. AG-I]|nr:hypothetical protein BDV93DRAFT_528696 [Ceratobasidium sp. AG-I]
MRSSHTPSRPKRRPVSQHLLRRFSACHAVATVALSPVSSLLRLAHRARGRSESLHVRPLSPASLHCVVYTRPPSSSVAAPAAQSVPAPASLPPTAPLLPAESALHTLG